MACSAVNSALKKYVTPDHQVIGGTYFGRPDRTDVSGFKWDGEWEVTYVTFRDMGIAFMAALVLIYVLVVAEFRSFLLPLVVMAPIPLTMIGIVPGHWLLGADFTATSMIGFIALAGIIVRNSILLVEFAREKVAEGMAVQDGGHPGGARPPAPDPHHGARAGHRFDGAAVRPDLPGHGRFAAVRLAGGDLPDAGRHPARLRLGAQIFHRPSAARRFARPECRRPRLRPDPAIGRPGRRIRAVRARTDGRPSAAPRAQE